MTNVFFSSVGEAATRVFHVLLFVVLMNNEKNVISVWTIKFFYWTND